MLINDLCYLESILEANTISGGVVVGVTAYSSGTVALTDTTTKAIAAGNSGVSIGIGRGTAVGSGSDPFAAVNLSGSGDLVIQNTQQLNLANKDTVVARGVVIAIDKPR
jgi:hypothetical protein